MKIKIVNSNSYGTYILKEIEYTGNTDTVLIELGYKESKSTIVGREVRKAITKCNDAWIDTIDSFPKKLREQFENRVDISFLRLGRHLRKIKKEVKDSWIIE
jgi:hypothetical protein